MNESVLRQINELSTLNMEQLRMRWKILYGTEPASYNKDFLMKRLAYRVQEIYFGGLSSQTKETMNKVLNDYGFDKLAAKPTKKPDRTNKEGIPVAGTKLIREWNGIRHEVIISKNGFQYNGKLYRSLSSIAREITGTQWNGPAFFGLRNKRKVIG